MLASLDLPASDQHVPSVDACGNFLTTSGTVGVESAVVRVFSLPTRRLRLATAVDDTRVLTRDLALLVAQYTVAQLPAVLIHHHQAARPGVRRSRLVAHFSADAADAPPAAPERSQGPTACPGAQLPLAFPAAQLPSEAQRALAFPEAQLPSAFREAQLPSAFPECRWGERELRDVPPHPAMQFAHGALGPQAGAPATLAGAPATQRPAAGARWDGAIWALSSLRKCTALDSCDWCAPIALEKWSMMYIGGCTAPIAIECDGVSATDMSRPVNAVAATARWVAAAVAAGGPYHHRSALYAAALPRSALASADLPRADLAFLPHQPAVYHMQWKLLGEFDRCETAKAVEAVSPSESGAAAVSDEGPAGCGAAPLWALNSASRVAQKFVLREDGEFQRADLSGAERVHVDALLASPAAEEELQAAAASGGSRTTVVVGDDGTVYSYVRTADAKFQVSTTDGRAIFEAGGVASYIAFLY